MHSPTAPKAGSIDGRGAAAGAAGPAATEAPPGAADASPCASECGSEQWSVSVELPAPVSAQLPSWRRLLAFIGPGFLIASEPMHQVMLRRPGLAGNQLTLLLPSCSGLHRPRQSQQRHRAGLADRVPAPLGHAVGDGHGAPLHQTSAPALPDLKLEVLTTFAAPRCPDELCPADAPCPCSFTCTAGVDNTAPLGEAGRGHWPQSRAALPQRVPTGWLGGS